VDFEDIDESLVLYARTHPGKKIVLDPTPTLADFFHPTESQKECEYRYVFIAGSVAIMGLLVYKYF
jgi:hypothetical protein